MATLNGKVMGTIFYVSGKNFRGQISFFEKFQNFTSLRIVKIDFYFSRGAI